MSFGEIGLHELAGVELAGDVPLPKGWVAAPSPLGAAAGLAVLVHEAWASAPSMLGAPEVLGTAGNSYLAWVAAPSPLDAPAAVAQPVLVGWVALPGPLGVAAVLGQAPVAGRVALGGPLAAPMVLARMPTLATAAAPSMLGVGQALAFHDFSVAGEVLAGVTYYALDLFEGGAVVARLPMASWQATLQTGRSNYLQAVVPAAAPWVAALTAASGTGEFVVQRGVRLADGAAIEQEMARAPLQTLRFDQGPGRLTGTLSGYTPAFAGGDATVRTLAQVRSQSFGAGGRRVRCGIDWFLRPGMQAALGAEGFEVAYINYYVSMGAGSGDAYMDVGERAVA